MDLLAQSPRIFDQRCYPGRYHDDVKAHAALTWPALHQVPARDATDLALLNKTHLRSAEPVVTAASNLNENQGPMVVGDNVQFA